MVEGKPVEFAEEGFEGGVEVFLKAADGGDGASIGFHVEAFDEAHVGLGIADDLSEADVLGGTFEAHTAGASGYQIDVAVFAESVHDADEVVFGNPVSLADGAGGDDLPAVRPEVDQDPEGVVGM